MFNHARFRDELQLSGVNSINWARIAAQTVYYFTAAVALGAPHRPVSFSVPTGNFGDILAGFVAKRMGLPIERLMIAHQRQRHPRPHARPAAATRSAASTPTTSPSMDIQISSNFERLLFEAHGRDAAAVRALMASLPQSRSFAIDAEPLARIRAGFRLRGGRRGQRRATRCGATYGAAGYLLDPHTRRRHPRRPRARRRATRRRPVVALVDRPSGEVPGCGRARDGRAPGAAAASRRPDGPAASASRVLAERPGRGRALHPRARPGGDGGAAA